MYNVHELNERTIRWLKNGNEMLATIVAIIAATINNSGQQNSGTMETEVATIASTIMESWQRWLQVGSNSGNDSSIIATVAATYCII